MADLFLVPNEGRYTIYAPLRGLIFEANETAVEQIREAHQKKSLAGVNPDILEPLKGGQWLIQSSKPAPFSSNHVFEPIRTTLFLTNACNLRCTYCYASAGDFVPQVMEDKSRRAAVDFVFKNAKARKSPLYLAFHGGGEPTLAWEALVDVVEYAVVNSTQLKHMASKARDAMNDFLPGGAGTNINTLVDSLQNTNNYAAINLGQLKYVFSFDSP